MGLCKDCIHTKICWLDKNTVGTGFVPGNPMFFDNQARYKEYKKWRDADFPCVHYVKEKHWHGPEDIPEKGVYLVYAKKYYVPDHVDEPDHIMTLQLAYYDEKWGWSVEGLIWWMELPEPPKEGIT